MKSKLLGLLVLVASPFDARAVPVILNPGFEENSNPNPGYGSINGWSGGSGTNNASQPFHAESGAPIPEGAQVAFQQGLGTLSQDISGFDLNQEYFLSYRENSRGPSSLKPSVEVRLDGVVIIPRHDVEKLSAYAIVTSAPFFYTGGDGTGLLELQNFSPATGPSDDNTALWDAFQITQVPEPSVALAVISGFGVLGLLRRRRA